MGLQSQTPLSDFHFLYQLNYQGIPISPISAQFSSVAQLCPTLCHPMDCSTPGLPVHHQLPEFTQTYVHWVGDGIQPSHPLSSPFFSRLQSFLTSGSFQMSQFFASVGQSIGVSPLLSLGTPKSLRGLSRKLSGKESCAMKATWVQFLGWEDRLEKEMATHSNILAWRILWTEEPGGLQSMGSQRVGHDWMTKCKL